jgi:hypothetical protein
MLALVHRPISEVRPQLLLSTTISTIKPSCRCPTSARSTASNRSAHSRAHLPPQPNPHSGVRGALRALSPAGSFLGGFRTPAAGGCRTALAGRHPKPCTKTGNARCEQNGSAVPRTADIEIAPQRLPRLIAGNTAAAIHMMIHHVGRAAANFPNPSRRSATFKLSVAGCGSTALPRCTAPIAPRSPLRPCALAPLRPCALAPLRPW